ncbi:MAG TPA: CDP-alcohol phosphatidyltransferase family protein [Halanaerobiales bacterium]|nr:CDP-alcohol phosphatidyltransferase family protein [Halanaerobiales bacterium]
MFNIPNFLTLIRLFLIPFYIYLFLIGNYIFSGILFIIATSTDLLDGYIARKYSMETEIGKLLDPIADKLTVISILSMLIYLDIIPRFIAIILLIRESTIFLSTSIAYILGKNFVNPSILGKMSIAFLYAGLAARLFEFNILSNYILYLALPLNIISGIAYFVNAIKNN